MAACSIKTRGNLLVVPGVYSGMFEQSIVDTTGRRSAALAASVTAQTILVGILILIPLFYGDHLPIVMPAMPLLLPVSAPPLPEPIETVATTSSPQPSILPTRVFDLTPSNSTASTARTGAIFIDGPASYGDGVGVSIGTLPMGAIEMPKLIVSAPAAAPVVSKPPEQPHVVGGDVQAAKLIRKIVPAYPPLARTAHVSGTVRLTGVIAKDGTIRQLQVIAGNPLLVRAAVDAVRQWLYKPTLLNGEAVEVIAPIDVIFILPQ